MKEKRMRKLSKEMVILCEQSAAERCMPNGQISMAYIVDFQAISFFLVIHFIFILFRKHEKRICQSFELC